MQFKKYAPEPVQPGNPHKLVINQHIVPAANIQRFYGANDRVMVAMLRESRILRTVSAGHDCFRVKRVWDQRAEVGFAAQIERRFQFLATRILAGDLSWWHLEQSVITEFYALWTQRSYFAANPLPDVKLNGVLPDRELTKDSREHLEANHILYLNEESGLAGRMITGMQIQRGIDEVSWHFRDAQWTLCRASPSAGEFLMPDSPVELFIPISPSVALLGGESLAVAEEPHMRYMNRCSLAASRRLVLARDFSACRF